MKYRRLKQRLEYTLGCLCEQARVCGGVNDPGDVQSDKELLQRAFDFAKKMG
jgi:hypothetical protein